MPSDGREKIGIQGTNWGPCSYSGWTFGFGDLESGSVEHFPAKFDKIRTEFWSFGDVEHLTWPKDDLKAPGSSDCPKMLAAKPKSTIRRVPQTLLTILIFDMILSHMKLTPNVHRQAKISFQGPNTFVIRPEFTSMAPLPTIKILRGCKRSGRHKKAPRESPQGFVLPSTACYTVPLA